VIKNPNTGSFIYLDPMNLYRVALFIISCAVWTPEVYAQSKTDSLLYGILSNSSSPVVKQVLSNPDSFRCQVIYTRIDRDKMGVPSFRNFYYHVNRELYFNPASMVKLPLAALSLEKLHALKQEGIDRETIVYYDSSYPKQVPLCLDSTSENGLPSIGQFIRKAFLISDNDAYNRMYQFVSQRTINHRLREMGYRNSRITRQFMGFDDAGNRHTNPIRFIAPDGMLLLIQPPAHNTDSFRFPRPVLIGNGYMNGNEQLVKEPFNFTRHNSIPLEDLQSMMKSIIFPASVRKKSRFKIDTDDQLFMLKYLSQYPSETSYPKYDDSLFYDSYVKFFFRDSTHKMPGAVRVFNKVGWAYGFLTDVSYVLDTIHNVEYMLAATIYVNADGILNDDLYEYDSIGYPFLYSIGKAVYEHELKRVRKANYIPGFGISYDHRDPNDDRPSIRIADN
jgi:hypothetical protein